MLRHQISRKRKGKKSLPSPAAGAATVQTSTSPLTKKRRRGGEEKSLISPFFQKRSIFPTSGKWQQASDLRVYLSRKSWRQSLFFLFVVAPPPLFRLFSQVPPRGGEDFFLARIFTTAARQSNGVSSVCSGKHKSKSERDFCRKKSGKRKKSYIGCFRS